MSTQVSSMPLRSRPVPVQLDLFETTDTGAAPTPTPEVDPPPEPAANLQEVLDRLTRLGRTGKFAQMASAVRKVGEVLGLPLAAIGADPAVLTPWLDVARPAMIGMNGEGWGRVRSRTRQALGHCGWDVMPARDIKGLTPAWSALAAPLPRRLRYGLSSLFSFCSRRVIEPWMVDDETFRAYERALMGSLKSNLQRRFRETVKLWNEAADTIEGWPPRNTVTVPDGRRSVIAKDAFPKSLRDEIEACLNQRADPDPFSKNWRRALRPSTIHGRRKDLYRAARLLVESGMDVACIDRVSVLVDVANAETVLRALHERLGKAPSVGNMAETLRWCAETWVRPPQEDLDRLRQMRAIVTIKAKGMTSKNQQGLDQFELDRNVLALLNLPERIQRQIEKTRAGTNTEAVRLAMALAVCIELTVPLRLANLVGLRLDKHIKVTGQGRGRIVRIVIPAEETKTGAPIEVRLREPCVRLLDAYMKDYRPRIAEGAGPYLFPGRHGAQRAPATFSKAISTFIRRETGLVMHVHLFRHFAVRLLRQDSPSDDETPRLVLTHSGTKLLNTTYGSPMTGPAFERWGDLVSDLRSGAVSLRRKTRPPKKGRRT